MAPLNPGEYILLALVNANSFMTLIYTAVLLVIFYIRKIDVTVSAIKIV